VRRRSLSLKLFLTLALVLLVTVVVFAVASTYALNSRSQRELGESSIGKLKVADAMVSHLKQSVNRETLRLMVNEAVKGLEGVGDRGVAPLDPEDLLKLSRVIDALREIVLTDDSYHSIYLYPDNLDFVLTSTQGFVPKKALNDTAWIAPYEEFRRHGAPLSWIDSRLPDDGKGFLGVGTLEYVMTFVSPLGPYTTPFHGALVVNFREASLSRRINSSNFDGEGYLAVINRSGGVISNPEKALLGRNIAGEPHVSRVLASPTGAGSFVERVAGERSLVAFVRSRDTDWIYVGVFSLRTLAGKTATLRASMIGLSVLFLAVGLATAFWLAKRLYSPLQHLYEDIRRAKGTTFADNGDEMSVILQAFETLKSREGRTPDEPYLSALLHGEQDHAGDAPKVRFFLPWYVCALVSVDNHADFVRTYGDERAPYARRLILEIAEQVLASEFICAGITTDGDAIPLIVNTDERDPARLQARLRDAFARVQKQVARVLDCTITVGIGQARPSRQGIKDSFVEARQASQLRLLFGYGSINSWNGEQVEQDYPLDIEKRMLKCLAQADIGGIGEAVADLVRRLRSARGLSSDAALLLLNQLIGNTAVKTVLEMPAELAVVYGPSFGVRSELATKGTLDEIAEWLTDVFARLVDYQGRTRSRHKDKAERITEIIHASYRGDISIATIADQLHLSYSHVRRIFKDHTGRNILDYINDLRIAEAKQMLEGDDLAVKEIAYRLGYRNAQGFTRAFKKIEGMTPAEYRSRVTSHGGTQNEGGRLSAASQ
jgi:AraC-like DNA-binding protein